MSLKILQINVGRSESSHDPALATAEQRDVHLVLLQEPNKAYATRQNLITDDNQDTAIFCRNKDAGVESHDVGRGYAVVHFRSFALYNCYVSPNSTLRDFERIIDTIMNSIRTDKKAAVVVGDLNAKSYLWGYAVEDGRGEYIADWLNALDMAFGNSGNSPTFVRGNSESIMDITFATSTIFEKLVNWEVLQQESLSHHRYIYFEIEDERRAPRKTRPCKPKINKEIFKSVIEILEPNIGHSNTKLIQIIMKAKKASQ
nr:uncharacterized protein LOC111513372 [Leptinotarsa decemlineata]